jgi:hypothetical protein
MGAQAHFRFLVIVTQLIRPFKVFRVADD